MEKKYGLTEQKIKTKDKIEGDELLQKINLKDLNVLKKDFLFYDFINQENKKQKSFVITFKEENSIVTYSDLQYGKAYDTFNFQMQILAKLILTILNDLNEVSVIITRYNESWIVNKTSSIQLSELLHQNEIRNNYSGAIETRIGDDIFKCFLESVFKYNSFINILLPSSKIVITPTDHMDIFFDFENCKSSEVLSKFFVNNKEEFNLLKITQRTIS